MKISLFGYGKTMQELSRKLAPCNIFDDKFCEVSKDDFGNTLLPSSMFNPLDSNLEIVSPGIPPNSPLIKNAKNLISEYDYFFPSPKSIWISGTNGKTTTTEMTQLLLEDFGSVCGGNIGTPLCNLSQNAKLWVLETSSFSLHYTNKANPYIYALLPVTPDHISWHGSFEKYVSAKLKPLTLMQKDSIAIIPKIYENSLQAKAYKGKIYFYDDAESLAGEFNISLEKLHFMGAFALDATLALCIAKVAVNKIDYTLLNSFKIGAHKIEEFRDSNGRLFVDDSKATNISATLEALKIYKDKFIFLILGGDNKGVSLEPLISTLKDYKVRVYSIGVSNTHIKNLCDKYQIHCQNNFELKNALDSINRDFRVESSYIKSKECSEKMDSKINLESSVKSTDSADCRDFNFKSLEECVCILSPACASLDQFSSYKHRGELFRCYALSLK